MFLETKQITKAFGGLRAVHSVDFSVEKGKITAIIGPNGAGKSTFFNLISGFHKPTEGQIIFKGVDITGMPANKVAKLGLARTFQTTHLFEQATLFENVFIGHRLRTNSNLFDSIFRTKRLQAEEELCKEKAWEVLRVTEIEHLADRTVANISQEEKKRAAISLALATDPEIIFLDEPAAGVNPDETDGLAELIRRIAANGITVCLIEHKMRMIMNLADHIMVLNHGEKIAEGTPDEIKNNESVIKAYLGGEAIA